jgi:ATP phosphoribosyltransferase
MLRIAIPNKGRLSEAPSSSSRPPASAPSSGRTAPSWPAWATLPGHLRPGPGHPGVRGRRRRRNWGSPGATWWRRRNRPEVTELLDLGFGRCRLVVAVRTTLRPPPPDLPGDPRGHLLPGARPPLLRGDRDPDPGGPGLGRRRDRPHLGVADVIVDLTSTGSTLRVNGLKEIGTILDSSSARSSGTRQALEGSAGTVTELTTALESVLRARKKRYLMANVPATRWTRSARSSRGSPGPTIVDVLDQGTLGRGPRRGGRRPGLPDHRRLKELGAEGILVTRIERLMP